MGYLPYQLVCCSQSVQANNLSCKSVMAGISKFLGVNALIKKSESLGMRLLSGVESSNLDQM